MSEQRWDSEMVREVNIVEGRRRSCGLLAASFTLSGDTDEKGSTNII